MMKHPTEPSLSGPEFEILLSLADGEKHGYAIMQDVTARTGRRTRMGPGTLYGAIKRMLRAGLIDEAEDRPAPDLDDQRRRYYRITPGGRELAVAETERMAELVRAARKKRLTRGSVAFDSAGE
jgi:DNA-binding PadR family transcriptional regulator